MYKHMSSFEVPVLLARGFSFGIDSSLLWGTDKTGKEYQVVDDDKWLLFGERRGNGGVNAHKRMSRVEFDALFTA